VRGVWAAEGAQARGPDRRERQQGSCLLQMSQEHARGKPHSLGSDLLGF